MSGPPVVRHYVEPRHVDDFIDDPKSNAYAASWFESFRRPAIDKMRKPDERKLFANYQGQRYLVTGCSRMGDVWLHSDPAYSGMSYEKRVDVDDCSAWSPRVLAAIIPFPGDEKVSDQPCENRPEYMSHTQLVADLKHERQETRELRARIERDWVRAEKAEARSEELEAAIQRGLDMLLGKGVTLPLDVYAKLLDQALQEIRNAYAKPAAPSVSLSASVKEVDSERKLYSSPACPDCGSTEPGRAPVSRLGHCHDREACARRATEAADDAVDEIIANSQPKPGGRRALPVRNRSSEATSRPVTTPEQDKATLVQIAEMLSNEGLHNEYVPEAIVAGVRFLGAEVDKLTERLERWSPVVAAAVREVDAGRATQDLIDAMRKMQRDIYGNAVQIFGPTSERRAPNDVPPATRIDHEESCNISSATASSSDPGSPSSVSSGSSGCATSAEQFAVGFGAGVKDERRRVLAFLRGEQGGFVNRSDWEDEAVLGVGKLLAASIDAERHAFGPLRAPPSSAPRTDYPTSPELLALRKVEEAASAYVPYPALTFDERHAPRREALIHALANVIKVRGSK